MTLNLIINYAIQVLGTGLAFFLAFHSFQKRSIQLGDEPTLPQYFTRQNLYWLGIAIYCVFIAGTYFLLIYAWLPLYPLIDFVVETLSAVELVKLFTGLDGGKLIPLMAALSFLFFVFWESRFNPLLILRDTVYDTFAIPRKAVEVYNALRTSQLSNIDKKLKIQIADRLLIASIDPGDFEKSHTTVEYKWAHNSVLFDQIQSYANQVSYQRFFSEPSLRWGDICISYNAMSEQVAVWKEAEPHYTKTVNLIKGLDELVGLLCRLLACLVIFGSTSDKEVWDTVKRLGGNPNQLLLKHTYKYLLIFAAVTVTGIMLGREFSILVHNNLIYPDNPLAHFDDATFRWIVYALAMYVSPIALVLVARTYAYRSSHQESPRYYGFYILMMLIGFIVSTSASALILELTSQEWVDFNFLTGFINHMRWGILPALMCGFVAYQMDTPVDEAERTSSIIKGEVLRFVGWAVVALIVMLYATDGLTIEELHLRFTIVGTSIFVVGFLGMAARFKTVESGG